MKRLITSLNLSNLLIAVTVGLIASLFGTGFVYGFFACSDCGWGVGGMLGRVWIGIVHAFLTIISFGKPWTNEGGTTSVNLQPYVLLVFIFMAYLIYRRLRPKTMSKEGT